jgi:hypothetical protein
MTVRSLTKNENGGSIGASSIRHSRARGNPGLFCRISLDTRLRGYDAARRVPHSHPLLSSGLLFAAESAARPVGVAVWTDGSLLVADDAAGKIWRVSAKE